MRHSIAASTFKPQGNVAAMSPGGGFDYLLGFNNNWQFITGDLGVIIYDTLLIPDSTNSQPQTDPVLDNFTEVRITVGNNPTTTGTLANGQVSMQICAIDTAFGGGQAHILYGNLFQDAYDSTSSSADIISIEIDYSVSGQVQSSPIKLFHRGGIDVGPALGYNVGCGEYRTLLTNAVTPANLSMGFKIMNINSYGGSGSTFGIKIAHDSPPTFNAPTTGLNISQGNVFFNGPVSFGDQLELIADPDISQFSVQHPAIVNLASGEELGFFCMAQDDFLPGFSAPSSGNFPGNSTPNAITFLNYIYFQVSEICEINANQDVVLGCTDPLACNYDPAANYDDGLCQYSDFEVVLNPDVVDGDYTPNGLTLNNDFWSPIAGGSSYVFDPTGNGGEHTITISWGTGTTALGLGSGGSYNPFPLDRVEMWVNDDVLGNAGYSIHEFVENVAVGTTYTDSSGAVDGGTAEVTFLTPVTFSEDTQVEFYFVAYPAGEYGTVNACSSVSSTLVTVTPEYISPGCTDPNALNYDPSATLSDGSCVFCNQGSDVFQTVNINNQQTVASSSGAADGETQIILSVPGQAFPVGSSTLGVLHVHEASVLSLADINTAFTTGNSASLQQPLVGGGSFNAEYLQPFNQSFNIGPLTGGTLYSYYITVPGITANNTPTNCFISGVFTQSYYACTEDSLDSVLLPFVTNAVTGTSIALSDPSDPLGLCIFDNSLIGSQSLSLTLLTGSNCLAQLSIVASGAVPGYTNIEITDPFGGVQNLNSQSVPGIINTSGNVNATLSVSGSGTYTAVMTTTLPGQSTVTFPTVTLEVTDAMLAFCGCTDPNANNYNPQATVDDGSCYITGCTDPSAINYNPNATNNQPGGGTQYCTYCVYGCMDPSASNFDVTASCPAPCEYFIPTFGCTDPQASNYDPAADSGDPVEYCTYSGCTDPNASNYDATQYTLPDGTQVPPNLNDGSCIYENNTIPGCTDPAADNYSSDATIDDGTCLYDGIDGNDVDIESGPVISVPDYEEFLNHLDQCVSKKLSRYYTKLITGQKCDEDVIVQLAMVNTLLKNKVINCLFDGSKKSIEKLNNLITFVLTYCDDCEYDLAPDQTSLTGAEEIEVNTLGGLQDSNNNNIIDAPGTDFVEPSSNNNNIIL